MKRFNSKVLCVALLICLTLVSATLGACGGGGACVHELTLVPPTDSTCITQGNISYYKCTKCSVYFSDEAGTSVILNKDSVLKALRDSHDGVFVPESEANCTTPTVLEHYECVDCHKLFTDEACSIETTLDALASGEPNDNHSGVFVDVKPSNCTDNGRDSHYECEYCHELFRDEDCTIPTNIYELELPLNDIHVPRFVEESPSTCTTYGTAAHYECKLCQVKFWDEDCTQNLILSELELPLSDDHNVTFVEGVPSTCTTLGTIDYYECVDCMRAFMDEEATVELFDKNMSATEYGPHPALTPVQGSFASCMYGGRRDHWECPECCNKFLDIDGNIPVTSEEDLMTPPDPTRHVNLNHVPEVPGDCYTGGTLEHWECMDCYSLFLDQSATTPADEYSLKTEPRHISVTYTEGRPATCSSDGEKDRYECTSCMQSFEDEDCTVPLTDPYLPMDPSNHLEVYHHEGQPADCYTTGTLEHWECMSCRRIFRDVDCADEIYNHDELYIPYTHAGIIHHDYREPSCIQEGYYEHWECTYCNSYSLSEDFKETTYDRPIIFVESADPSIHELTHYEYKKPTCIESGHMEYNYCSRCYGYFDQWMSPISESDVYMGYESSPDYHEVEYLPYTEPSCLVGNIECYRCIHCESYYRDEFGYEPISSDEALIPANGNHSITYVEGSDATCTDEGLLSHYSCKICSKLYTDGTLSVELSENDVVIPAKGHDGVYVAPVDATCTATGNIEHWYCAECDGCYLDEDCLTKTQDITTPKSAHSMTHYPEIPAKCEEAGVKEYYYCSECMLNYSDNAGTATVDDTYIEPTGHKYATTLSYDENEHYYAAICEHDTLRKDPVSHTIQSIEHTKPGCTDMGSTRYYCDCGYSYILEDIRATGHALSYVEYVAPSCKAAGNEEHWHCANCKLNYTSEAADTVIDTVVIPALPHSMSDYTYDYYKHYKVCTDCGLKSSGFHSLEDGVCSQCEASITYAEGLDMTVSSSGITVNGRGSYTGTELIIAPTYNGKSVVALQEGAFENDTAIEVVAIPYTVKTVSRSAFSGCTALKEVFLAEGVTTIDTYAFNMAYSLTDINFPSTVKTIGNTAFGSTKALKSVTLNEGLLRIEEGAFNQGYRDGEGLTSIVIPSTVTYVGNYAFNSYNLNRVDILGSPTIDDWGLTHCPNINIVNVPSLETWLNINWVYDYSYIFHYNNAANQNQLYVDGIAIDNITIPSSITALSNVAFKNVRNSFHTIDLTGLVSVGTESFNGVTANMLVIPDTITSIGEKTFLNTSFQSTIIDEDNPVYYSEGNSIIRRSDNALVRGSDQTSLPDGTAVSAIDRYAFAGSTRLSTICIPEGVTTIGGYAFYNSTLQYASIPSTVTVIGERAFRGSSLTRFDIADGSVLKTVGDYAFCYTHIETVTLPQGVETLGEYAFGYCERLTTVQTYEGLVDIGDYAFDQCALLTTINIPSTVTRVGIYAFRGCDSIAMENKIRYVGNWAVYADPSIVNAVIKDGTTNVADGLFMDSHISTLKMPNTVKRISNSMFRRTAFWDFELYSWITSIGDYAFSGNTNLKSVYVDGTILESIGEGAFEGCTKLETLYTRIPETVWNNVTFGDNWDKDTGEYTIQYNSAQRFPS